MRVLFVALAPTHYFPMVPLAWALRAAGHEVRVAAQPPVASAITGSGLNAVQLDGDYDFMANSMAVMRMIEERVGRLPANFDTEEGERALPADVVYWVRNAQLDAVVKTAVSMAGDLVEFSEWWRPDLVVTDPLAFAAPLAAEAVGAPLARHLWGPGLPGVGIPTEYWLREHRELFDRYGVPARAEYAACNIDPCPPSLQVPEVPDQVPMRFVPYNGAGELPEWLRRPAERQRVCITMGTVRTDIRGATQVLLAEYLKALADLDVEVVAALGRADRELLGELPAGVRVIDWLPLHLLLPTCGAVVHHGGAGTALTALSAGVPQCVVDAEPDDHIVERSLCESGVGVSFDSTKAGPDEFAAAVGSLLAQGPQQAAARLRAENLARPAPSEVVPTLEMLLRDVVPA
jgi:UDP:flavonoid glycosyltransferase YjiC (YdhE family)